MLNVEQRLILGFLLVDNFWFTSAFPCQRVKAENALAVVCKSFRSLGIDSKQF
jgi:hypothetical protein